MQIFDSYDAGAAKLSESGNMSVTQYLMMFGIKWTGGKSILMPTFQSVLTYESRITASCCINDHDFKKRQGMQRIPCLLCLLALLPFKG